MSKSKFTGDFNKSLRWGKHFEWSTITFIQDTFNKVLNSDNKKLRFLSDNTSTSLSEMKKWDVIYEIVDTITNQRIKTITFEIKADGYDSNNIFVERKCNTKISGVYATQADFFLYILPRHKEDNVYLARPSAITNHLDKLWETHLTYAGDNNKSYGYLIDRFEFNSSITTDIKLYSYEFSIPMEYGLEKIPTTKKVVYYGDNFDFKKRDDNPFDF